MAYLTHHEGIQKVRISSLSSFLVALTLQATPAVATSRSVISADHSAVSPKPVVKKDVAEADKKAKRDLEMCHL